MSCACDVTTGVKSFPDNLVCILQDGYGSTLPQKKRYLGNKTALVDPLEVSIVIFVKNNVDAACLMEWWVSELNYGTEQFLITIPIFGISKEWTAKAITALPESLKNGETKEVKIKLTISDDLAVAISENLLCEGC